ncbi:hypothetical protein NDU88_001279 [Pleurodeles waltl]|uniref:Uncharacterized protein n=1 Tax=Pleurodeles waltl TaxID=8319 RepID=A0AAV7ND02_PLEWA|nr:hypothetical protein NDU88_001279 [Pleurodeles waltl]
MGAVTGVSFQDEISSTSGWSSRDPSGQRKIKKTKKTGVSSQDEISLTSGWSSGDPSGQRKIKKTKKTHPCSTRVKGGCPVAIPPPSPGLRSAGPARCAGLERAPFCEIYKISLKENKRWRARGRRAAGEDPRIYAACDTPEQLGRERDPGAVFVCIRREAPPAVDSRSPGSLWVRETG